MKLAIGLLCIVVFAFATFPTLNRIYTEGPDKYEPSTVLYFLDRVWYFLFWEVLLYIGVLVVACAFWCVLWLIQWFLEALLTPLGLLLNLLLGA